MSAGSDDHRSTAEIRSTIRMLIACRPRLGSVRSCSARYLSRRSGLKREIPFEAAFLSGEIGISGGSGWSSGQQKSLLEDPGGSDHDGCVKRLASRRPPARKRRKGKAESPQSCAALRTGLHVSVKGTDICRYDAHAQKMRTSPSFVNSLIPSAWFMTAFPLQSEIREMATVRIFRRGNGQAERLISLDR
jgi:hypothetical protein